MPNQLVYSLFSNFYCFDFSSADNSVHMFDRRNLGTGGVGSPVYKFKGHEAAVLSVQVFGIILLTSWARVAAFNCLKKLLEFWFDDLSSILCALQWCPDKSSVFGSAAEDGIVNIWDHDKVWTLCQFPTAFSPPLSLYVKYGFLPVYSIVWFLFLLYWS